MATPIAGKQAPGFYRCKVGDIEVTVLSDGNVPLDTNLFHGDPAGREKLLKDAFLPTDAVATPINQWLVNTGAKLVLVDTGAADVFAPTLGRMGQHLAAAGAKPGEVDDVIITHMHPDHIPGLLDTDKTPRFKNAIVHINADEYAFWQSDENRAKIGEPFQGFFDIARASIKPYADAGKLQLFKPGAQIAPGLTTIHAPGHTVGHTMVRVSSGATDFLIWTDIVHNIALQFPEPERSIAFDTDPALAIATRKKAFDMVATDRLLFGGAHMPFPGLGHLVRSAGGGYTFVPLHYAEHL
jgi:glyoxylase-like metal-dependent hydrolase (beta-lactamase superfamily II)